MDPVGRYQILEELGRGAHGVVYKALDPAIGRTIAIKAIAIGDIDTADRERVRKSILREARLAGTLSHPSVVTVFDVVDSQDAAYIVMEFVDGESLESAIASVKEGRPGVLTRNGFLSIFRQVAQALDYAHRKGVVHRDVKPANIVLTGQRMDQTGELIAKITDFGVAKSASQEATRQLGGTPALVGTPNYMSPEQVEGTNLGGAADQFSLAVIAYEVLTGQKAFSANSLDALLYRIRHEPEEQVNLLNLQLSPTVAKVMQRALAKNPDDRFTTCGEFAGALEFALGDSPQWTPGGLDYPFNQTQWPVVSPFADVEPPAEQSSWGRRLALLVGLCLAVGLALILMVRMNSGSPIPTQIVETKGAPMSPPPPPSIDELKGEAAPAIVNTPDRVTKPAVEKSPVEPARKMPAVPVRQVKQVAVSSEVQFSTDPPSANVDVDGMNSCLTPCSFVLPPGRHTLAASLAGFGVAHKIFNVPEDLSVFVPLVKSIGVLLITSDPTGATVNVDGQLAGRAPVTLRLSPGAHRVSVWDGVRWHDESIQISSDEVRTRLFRF